MKPTPTEPSGVADDFDAALHRMGLLAQGSHTVRTPLTGGVSSDIFMVELASGPICIKRALPQLKVQKQWLAPIERNRWEVEWMRVAAAVEVDFVPRVIGEDRQAGMFAMQFLPADQYPVWKHLLRDGQVDVGVAHALAARIAHVHAHTARDASMASRFDTDAIFHAIRLEPYLAATAREHPDLADALLGLLETTLKTKHCVVHGDVSPKNILVGPRGPVLLDAECAWYGDPASDLAFCLNHLLLKCLWRPYSRAAFLACFDQLANSYLNAVSWEPADELERRAAALLPGLLLGRIDGKSPVEYITEDAARDRVRRVARALLTRPVPRLAQVREAWREELEGC